MNVPFAKARTARARTHHAEGTMTSKSKILIATILATLGTTSVRADAQAPAADQVAAARSLGTEGVEAADAGDCVRAIDRLTRAEALFHAPTTLERLGECQISTGKIVAGVESLNRVIREPFPGTAPPAFLAAQSRAKKALEAALPRIGHVQIHVEKPADVVAVVKVDGEVVRAELLDIDRPIDPGPHKVEATAPGYRTSETNVTVASGKKSDVTLQLEVDPTAALAPVDTPTTAPKQDAPPQAAAEPPPARKTNVPAYVAFGVGGAGVIVGTVFGIMALGTKSTLNDACTANKACPASSQADIDSLGSKATISTIGFIVGAVGIAGGAVLLLTTGKSPQHVSAWLGPGSAGVGGTFQ